MSDPKKDIEKLLKDFAYETQSKLKNELSWTTNLKENIEVSVDGESLSLLMPKYGIFVDMGRAPGKQPPLNIIYDWCKSKGIPTSAAYPIAKKIGDEGLEAHPFLYIFEDALETLTNQIGDVIVKNIVEN